MQWIPTMNKTSVCLNPLDCTLDFITSTDGLEARNLPINGFQYMWSGGRASLGITTGKYYFKCQILSYIPNHHQPNMMSHQNPFRSLDATSHVRIGFSYLGSDVGCLGENDNSWGFENTGKLVHKNIYCDYGRPFHVGEQIYCLVDLDTPEYGRVSFADENSNFGIAFKMPRPKGIEDALFPHVIIKNATVKLSFEFVSNLGHHDLGATEIAGFQPWKYALMNQMSVNTAPQAPILYSECEVLTLIGLPGAGKTKWASQHTHNNPSKRYIIIGTDLILKQMRVSEEDKKACNAGTFPELYKIATDIFNELLLRASKLPRNYILDQTNLFENARVRKLSLFQNVGFVKRAIVFAVPDEILFNRQRKQHLEEGKFVPIQTIAEMKANFTMPMKGPWPHFDDVIYIEAQGSLAEEIIQRQREAGRFWLQHHVHDSEDMGMPMLPPPLPPPSHQHQNQNQHQNQHQHMMYENNMYGNHSHMGSGGGGGGGGINTNTNTNTNNNNGNNSGHMMHQMRQQQQQQQFQQPLAHNLSLHMSGDSRMNMDVNVLQQRPNNMMNENMPPYYPNEYNHEERYYYRNKNWMRRYPYDHGGGGIMKKKMRSGNGNMRALKRQKRYSISNTKAEMTGGNAVPVNTKNKPNENDDDDIQFDIPPKMSDLENNQSDRLNKGVVNDRTLDNPSSNNQAETNNEQQTRKYQYNKSNSDNMQNTKNQNLGYNNSSFSQTMPSRLVAMLPDNTPQTTAIKQSNNQYKQSVYSSRPTNVNQTSQSLQAPVAQQNQLNSMNMTINAAPPVNTAPTNAYTVPNTAKQWYNKPSENKIKNNTTVTATHYQMPVHYQQPQQYTNNNPIIGPPVSSAVTTATATAPATAPLPTTPYNVSSAPPLPTVSLPTFTHDYYTYQNTSHYYQPPVIQNKDSQKNQKNEQNTNYTAPVTSEAAAAAAAAATAVAPPLPQDNTQTWQEWAAQQQSYEAANNAYYYYSDPNAWQHYYAQYYPEAYQQFYPPLPPQSMPPPPS